VKSISWLVLVYRIPSEPTRWRAAVWRRLRGAGAIYLQNSVAALPATPAAERLLRGLRNEIVGEMSGTAQVLRATALDGESEIVAAFNAARDDEYEEIVDRCKDFLAEIEGNTKAEHFTYGELEENDEDLNKLRNWHAKVVSRDAFSAGRAQDTEEALEACAKALDGFAARVYEADHG
jgi:tRNA threonylcarbamoyladenosine modification (KEOPS) complex Cgi121 subunit